MTDTASPANSPASAIEALASHVPLRLQDRRLALAFISALQNPPLDSSADDDVDPVVRLVASDAFGRQLARRIDLGDPTASTALVHLLMDRRRLQRVVEEAGLALYFMTFDWD